MLRIIQKWYLVFRLRKDRNKYSFWERVISRRESNEIFNSVATQVVDLGAKATSVKFSMFKFNDIYTNSKRVGVSIKVSARYNDCDLRIKVTYLGRNQVKTQCVIWDDCRLVHRSYIDGLEFFSKIKN